MSARRSFPMSCKDLCFVFMFQESISVAVIYAHNAPSTSAVLDVYDWGDQPSDLAVSLWQGVEAVAVNFLTFKHTGSSKTLSRTDRHVFSVMESPRLCTREISYQTTISPLIPLTTVERPLLLGYTEVQSVA